jgi:NAD(P)-dependent dehydrogenase (short-subunit alcohol dehydrogenase family)
MNITGKLEGKRALVTGAGTGIGREIAVELARQGADVVLHFSHDRDNAESASREIKAMGRRAERVKADFNVLSEVASLAELTIEFLGGVDILVNNAGITFNSPFRKTTVEQFDTLVNVNLRGPFLLTQRIADEMITNGTGVICNLTSIHGLQGAPEHSAYAATKGAIIAFTRALSVELGHHGVRVNAIAPGWIMVESSSVAVPGLDLTQANKRAEAKVPLGRYGVPSDIAKLAAYLCSEDASFITGQTFVVDGGSSALMSLLADFKSESAARFGTGYIPGRE